jgi:hypothetical protein
MVSPFGKAKSEMRFKPSANIFLRFCRSVSGIPLRFTLSKLLPRLLYQPQFPWNDDLGKNHRVGPAARLAMEDYLGTVIKVNK